MVTKADLTEMVFEGREQLYGAYFLRKKYVNHLAIATASVLALLMIGIFAPRIMLGGEAEFVENLRETGEINIIEFPPPPPVPEDVITPPPPPQPPTRQLQTIAVQIPVPTPQDKIEEPVTIEENTLLDTVKAVLSTSTQEGISADLFNEIPGDGEAGPPEVIQPNDPDPGVFVFVTEEPKELNIDEVKKLIGYPELARDANIQGQVMVRILVDEQGKYRKHIVVKKVHPILSDAVEAQLYRLKFTPAIQGNKPIKFWVNIPFRFTVMN